MKAVPMGTNEVSSEISLQSSNQTNDGGHFHWAYWTSECLRLYVMLIIDLQ